jgi:hypothetical protein
MRSYSFNFGVSLPAAGGNSKALTHSVREGKKRHRVFRRLGPPPKNAALSRMATSSDACASAHVCSGAVVRLTVDDPVVPPGLSTVKINCTNKYDFDRNTSVVCFLPVLRIQCFLRVCFYFVL